MKKIFLALAFLLAFSGFSQTYSNVGYTSHRGIKIPTILTTTGQTKCLVRGTLGKVFEQDLPSGGGSVQDLQSVLTNGNRTDNQITFGPSVLISSKIDPFVTIDINGLYLKTITGLSNASSIKNDNATSNCTFNLPLVPASGTYNLATDLDLNLKADILNPRFTGNVGIGTATPGTKLAVVGLPIFVDNAAAILGGLEVGDFYRTVIGILMVRF